MQITDNNYRSHICLAFNAANNLCLFASRGFAEALFINILAADSRRNPLNVECLQSAL